jgi:predicted nuclease of predicted toxin-antitoxin system
VSSLFICLYLDEDVNILVADLLKARGFDAITARDAGTLKATDAEQFTYAVSQARTLVTHNRTDA